MHAAKPSQTFTFKNDLAASVKSIATLFLRQRQNTPNTWLIASKNSRKTVEALHPDALPETP